MPLHIYTTVYRSTTTAVVAESSHADSLQATYLLHTYESSKGAYLFCGKASSCSCFVRFSKVTSYFTVRVGLLLCIFPPNNININTVCTDAQ